jgi:hypothetical protein
MLAFGWKSSIGCADRVLIQLVDDEQGILRHDNAISRRVALDERILPVAGQEEPRFKRIKEQQPAVTVPSVTTTTAATKTRAMRIHSSSSMVKKSSPEWIAVLLHHHLTRINDIIPGQRTTYGDERCWLHWGQNSKHQRP